MKVPRRGLLVLALIALTGVVTGCSSSNDPSPSAPSQPPSSGVTVAPSPTEAPSPSEPEDGTSVDVSTSTDPEVTLGSASMSCSHLVTLTTCQIEVWYGNQSDHAQQVDALTTMIVDAAGRTYIGTTSTQNADSLLLNPGLRRVVRWSVDLPPGMTPTQLTWDGPNGSSSSVGVSEPRSDPTPAVVATPPTPGGEPTQPIPKARRTSERSTPKATHTSDQGTPNNPGGFTGSVE